MPGLLLSPNKKGWPRVGKMHSADEPKPARTAEAYQEHVVAMVNRMRIIRAARRHATRLRHPSVFIYVDEYMANNQDL